MKEIVYPRPLQQGDKIAIVSPASIINPDYVAGAAETLRRQGWEPVVYPHALGECGSYSAEASERLKDILDAISDTEIRAIICSRGGYGTVHLLSQLAVMDLRRDPKWLIGFSDISALHALFASQGVASIHASMCKHLTQHPDDYASQMLFKILRGEGVTYDVPAHRHNRRGVARGRLVGGNMAVLGGLIGTPYNLFSDDTILFIEDIAEPIYKIERILYQLRLSGVLARLRGLIVGQFTEYNPDRNYRDIYDMIADMVAPYDYPVAFDFPVGHVDDNLPMIESASAILRVGEDSVVCEIGRE